MASFGLQRLLWAKYDKAVKSLKSTYFVIPANLVSWSGAGMEFSRWGQAWLNKYFTATLSSNRLLTIAHCFHEPLFLFQFIFQSFYPLADDHRAT